MYASAEMVNQIQKRYIYTKFHRTASYFLASVGYANVSLNPKYKYQEKN